ncbi:hypothetical protein F8568_044810 [Actinomadura sp. LD22]|uniref:Uncharacterized protein n=1 Tax=Actinomadura physcomitrii TaxID=2650748 RepID=A0A6I4MNC2_9ACTN|nr:hypothetical protein [Actinomadura physcomitrii]MWA07332.1 hypothetical protein [Actinomadura physcomitrii]
MSNTPPTPSLTATDLAEILFSSGLQASDNPTPEQVRSTVDALARTCAGAPSACAARVAQEAGDHPDTFAVRMRWALDTVHDAYGDLTTAA